MGAGAIATLEQNLADANQALATAEEQSDDPIPPTDPLSIAVSDAISALNGGISAQADLVYSVYHAAMSQCGKLKDRVFVADIFNQDVQQFRDKIGTENLNYTAAYHPWLETTLTYALDEEKVTITGAQWRIGRC